MRRTSQAMLAGVASLAGWTAAGAARADHTSAHFTLVSNLAATDNVQAAPDGGDRQADVFLQVRPGVLLAYETPRLIQELVTEIEGLEYIRNYADYSVNFHGGYRAKADPTPRSTVILALNGTTGRLSQLGSQQTPDATGVALTRPGVVNVRQADGSEQYAYQLTQDLRILQGLYGRYADTNDQVTLDTTSQEAGATLALDKTLRADAFTLEAGVSVLHLQRLGPVDGPAGVDRLDRQLNPHATLNWRHDYNKRWSTSFTGGLAIVNPYGVDPFNPLDTSRTRQFFPVFTGQVNYTDQWGHAAVTAGRQVTPNLFIAENTITDSALASASVPLWFTHRRRAEPQYVGAASLGYARTQLIDDQSGVQVGTFAVYHADVGVAYQPSPGLAYGVRLEYFRQATDASASSLFGSYSRTTLFATLAFRWPEQITVDVPRKSSSARADGSDLSPVGEEPVVPDEDPGDKRGQGGGGNQGGPGTGGVSGPANGTSGQSGTGTGGVSGGGDE